MARKTVFSGGYAKYLAKCLENGIPPLTEREWKLNSCPSYRSYAIKENRNV